MCIEVSTPPPYPLQNTILLIFCQAFCKLPKPLFRQLPIYIVFFDSPSPKNWWIPIILTFFIFNRPYLLKVIVFLVKISQFKFLVMADEHFGLYFFCCLKFQILVYFLCNNCDSSLSLLKKSSPLLHQPSSQNWDPVRPPFLKIWLRLNPPGETGMHTM